MPYIQVNGANLYYETFGQQQADGAPLLLIHGSTVTGALDWSGVVGRLAQCQQVFVPDCRGHGKSSNPAGSYSFRQMADDFAEFIGALGFEKMHVVGHSNGGNVALLMLMEHPEVCQSVTMQAANAYVTDYLREREPLVMSPEYYLQHNPGEVEMMIRAHGETFGAEYWRELLTLTMREIISEPNYSPQDLAVVKTPVLVTMGSEDSVNAPDRHAQYIAENIPGAELWIPQGIGHHIHLEIPGEWVERVQQFIDNNQRKA